MFPDSYLCAIDRSPSPKLRMMTNARLQVFGLVCIALFICAFFFFFLVSKVSIPGYAHAPPTLHVGGAFLVAIRSIRLCEQLSH